MISLELPFKHGSLAVSKEGYLGKTLLHILFLLLFQATEAQKALQPLRHLSAADGLAGLPVKYIYQDSRGLIWLCTVNGLQRFDGKNFTTLTFDPRLPQTSLPSGILNYGITEDPQGNIWATTEHEGPVKYDTRTGYVTAFNHSVSSREQLRSHAIHCTRKGDIYISTITGLMQIAGKKMIPVPLPAALTAENQNFRSLMEDRQGNLWIASTKGFLRYNPDKTWQATSSPSEPLKIFHNRYNIASAVKDADDNIWYSSWEMQQPEQRFLYRYSTMRNILDSTRLPVLAGDEHNNIPLAMTADKKGNIWLATISGHILVYNNSLQLIADYSHILFNERNIKPEVLSALFCDRNGNIWIASNEGVYITPAEAAPGLTSIPLSASGFTLQLNNTGLVGTPSGNLFVNNKPNGLLLWDQATEKLQQLPQTVIQSKWKNYLNILAADSTGLYVNPWFTDAVLYFNERKKKFTAFLPAGKLQDMNILLLPVSTGILISGKNAVYHYARNGMLLDSFRIGESHTIICDWKVKTDSTVWMIDTGASIYEVNTQSGKTEKKYSLPLRGEGYSLAFFGNYLLTGTRYEGVRIIDSTGQPVASFTSRDGLLSNNIRKLFNGRDGKLWIETANGFNYITQSGKWEINTLPALDKRFNPFSAAVYDGAHGFYFLYRDNITHTPFLSFHRSDPDPFLFTDIRAGTEVYMPDSASALAIAWNKMPLSFSFAALDYAMAANLQYRYRLRPLDTEWIPAGNNNQIILSALRSGRYTLEVQYRQPNSSWQEDKTLYLRLRITPPFWQQTWFILLMAAGVIAGVWFWYKKHQQAKKKIETLRWQLSRDLHDDIGATLSSISVYSAVLENRITDDRNRHIVEEIKEKATSTIQNMSDIIWAIQPGTDQLSDFVQRFQTYAMPLLESKNIRFLQKGNTADTTLRLSILQRRNLFLVCKEALNNCIKYAAASSFSMEIMQSKNELRMVLADDGVGFDEGVLTRKNGILNMQHRIGELQGTIFLKTAPGRGCSIDIAVPLP